MRPHAESQSRSLRVCSYPRSLEVDDEMAPSAAAAADEVLQHLFRLVDEEVAGERPGIEKSTVFN